MRPSRPRANKRHYTMVGGYWYAHMLIGPPVFLAATTIRDVIRIERIIDGMIGSHR